MQVGLDLLSGVARQARVVINRVLPDRPVRRIVRGVSLVLPRRHLLPAMAFPGSPYAANLVELAQGLAKEEARDLVLLDIGANVGDSVRFVLAEVDGTAVCVEADPEWLHYLELNVAGMANVAVEPAILLPPDREFGAMAALHHDAGTSQMQPVEAGGDALPTVTTEGLLERHAVLADVRLIKTDTDGSDVVLVPALVRTFGPSRPVVFFEFDPRPTKLWNPDADLDALWGDLVDHGYESAVVWDNHGNLLCKAPTEELRALSRVLDFPPSSRHYGFWDVAVAHRDDPGGLRVLAGVGA